jgi:exoribonuclease R
MPRAGSEYRRGHRVPFTAVPLPRLRLPDDGDVTEGLRGVRERLEIPAGFPSEVEQAAAEAAAAGPSIGTRRSDRRDLDLVTIDPPGSRDLDQAFHAEHRGSGFRVHYAIADVAAFVVPDGPIATEAWNRGVTLYSPDHRATLHPDPIGVGAASLLAAVDRPAILWTIDIDEDGSIADIDVDRSMVRSREQMTYRQVQDEVDSGRPRPALDLLPQIGAVRRDLLRRQGGISLHLPDQEVVRADGAYRLVYEEPLPVEGWNEQISLLAGMAGAQLMLDAGIGILRTLPRPDRSTVEQLGRSARALDVPWSDTAADYAAILETLDPAIPAHAALITASSRLFRGAAYEPFQDDPPEDPAHHAIGGPYTHVTAPLRRLIDRYTNEIALSVVAGEAVPEWVEAGFDELPRTMSRAKQVQGRLDRATVDLMEALILTGRVGEVFPAVVTAIDDEGRATVQLADPAVIARLDGTGLEPGVEASVRLVAADVSAGEVHFAVDRP